MTIKLYNIDHALTNLHSFSEEVLATFTDEQVSEYYTLYEEYQTVQRSAASEGMDLARELRKKVVELFQDSKHTYPECKQVKYFDRMIRNGETVVDKHASKYPNPSLVKSRVESAKERFGNLTKSRVTVGGDDTLQEINNAVSYLMDKGMELNLDFTVSNAVSLAQAHASSSVLESVHEEKEISLEQLNIALDIDVKPSNYVVVRNERYNGQDTYYLKSVALGEDEFDSVYINLLRPSFEESATPTFAREV